MRGTEAAHGATTARSVEEPGRRAHPGWTRVAMALITAGFVLDATFGWLSRSVRLQGEWSGDDLVTNALFLVTGLTFPAVGVLIMIRHPGNLIGRLMVWIGVFWAIGNATTFSDYGLLMRPGSVPGAALVAAVGSGAWIPALGVTGFLIMYFATAGWRHQGGGGSSASGARVSPLPLPETCSLPVLCLLPTIRASPTPSV